MHSAGYAMWLAVALGLNENEAWLTALMVRLGELIIGQADHATLLAVESVPLPAQARWQLEQERLGFHEGEVMSEVARSWYFPESMVDALHKCAKPMAFMAFSPLAAVTHMATLLADMESVDAESLQALPQDVASQLGLQLEWMAEHIPARTTFTESKAP